MMRFLRPPHPRLQQCPYRRGARGESNVAQWPTSSGYHVQHGSLGAQLLNDVRGPGNVGLGELENRQGTQHVS